MSYIWKPTKSIIENSNIYRFMKKHRIKTYKQLVSRSQKDIVWFWDAVVKDLDIKWFKPYRKVLDTSKGIPWAKWFVNGKTNIAYNCIDKHATSFRRNKIGCIYEGEDGRVEKLSYYDLLVRSCQLAEGLKQMGISKGDAVGIFMPMVPETIIAFFAVMRIGGIVIPLFSGYGPDAVSTRLNDCNAKVLITRRSFQRKGNRVEMLKIAQDAVSQSPSIEKVIVAGDEDGDLPSEKYVKYSDVISSGRKYIPPESMDSEDPCLIVYTSGTTGKPKGAVHVHGGFLVKITEEVAYQTDLHDDDILFWFTDIGWIMGPWEIVGGLAMGGTIFIYDGVPDYPGPDRLWAMIERHGITILGISPTAIRALMRYGEDPVKKHDLSSLRILGSTGEPWNPEPYMWYFKNVGGGRCPIINISGGTEVGACFLSPLPIQPLKPCTLGGPALGMDIDVFDENGKPVRGKVGELVCKKPWPGMTRGLWKAPERYIETYWSRWKDVWVHGDWASIDKNGNWFLHGRSDDTIKVAGKRIGPAEVESALVSHPAVTESAAIGVPDELKGEAIVCFAVIKPGYSPDDSLKEELKNTVAQKLGKTMVPKDIKFVKELPKTRNAKIMRRLIRARYLGQDVGDTSSLENPHALNEITPG